MTDSNILKRLPIRYIVAVLGSVGLGIIYGLKSNFHVAIVSMVNHSALDKETSSAHNNSNICEPTNTTISIEDGPFSWSTSTQGTLLSAYFWGYMVAQIPGGRLAELFSAKWVMFFSVFINVVCTLLTPLMAKLHYGALLAMRIGEGIGGGVTFPAMHVMLAHWAPPCERSVMSSIVYAGTALGTVIFTLISGLIAGGISWEAIFYIEGGISVTWLILWVILVSDSPQNHRFITADEKTLISSSLNTGDNSKSRSHPKVPWKSVVTSPPFLAILVAHTCSNWGWYVVLIELPQYMKNVLNFSIKENSILLSVPYLCMWLFSMILSKSIDVLRAKNVISTTTARKFSTLMASVVPAIAFIILCYIGCRRPLAVVVVTIAVMCIGGMFSGFLSNHIDIAPNYAGTLMALTNTFATIPGIVVPVVVGKLMEHDHSIKSWRVIFWITVIMYLIEILVYSLFGSGDEQPWNKLTDSENVEVQPLKSPNSPFLEKKNYESTNKSDEDNKESTEEQK